MDTGATADRAYPATLGSPPAVVDLAELVALFNACERRVGRPERWDRWNTRRMCEGAFGVRFRQDRPASKLYLTVVELRESGLWDALKHADDLAQLLTRDIASDL